MRRLARVVLLGLYASVVLIGCRGRHPDHPGGSSDPLASQIATLVTHLETHPQDDASWRDLAYLYWLHAERVDDAIPILDRLASRGDPWAQLGRALIARDRMDHDLAWKHAAALLKHAATASGPADARVLAEPAARVLEAVQSGRSSEDTALLHLTDTIETSRLPVEAAQVISSMHAVLDRRMGRPYKQHYDAQGCVRQWNIGRPEGSIGAIELDRMAPGDGGFRADPQAVLGVLACAVRIHNPTPNPAIRRLVTTFDVAGSGFRLQLASRQPMRVYMDGTLILATDRSDRWPARYHWFDVATSPGAHDMEVHLVIPDTRAWLLARATDLQGRPLSSRAAEGNLPLERPRVTATRRRHVAPDAGRLGSEIYTPLRQYLALEDALADGDSFQAETVVARSGDAWDFAAGQLLLSSFHAADPSRGRAFRTDRQRRALGAALDVDPAAERARLQLMALDLLRGEGVKVAQSLKALPKHRLASVQGELLRRRVYLDRGSDYLAEQALDRAAKLDPQSCDVLLAQRRSARRHDRLALEDELTAQVEHCPGTLSLRARWAVGRGKLSLARRLWREQLGRTPDDVAVLEALADLAVSEQRYGLAAQLHANILRIAPYRLASYLQRADLGAHAGAHTQARRELGLALERLPHVSRLREMGRALQLEDDLWEWRVDGSKVVEDYRRHDADYGGAGEVLVLDRDVARVYENGGQRHLVHQIVHLLSKASLDRHGELVPPDRATVLTLRSIKPDGTVVEPELIDGKDGLSLRNLEIDDLVEFEYLIDVDPQVSLPGYFDLSHFRFQSLDVPYHLSELVVLYPASLKPLVERRNGAPEVKIEQRGERRVMSFRAEEMPRRAGELHHRSLIDELPMVRVHTALPMAGWLDRLANRIRWGQRVNPALVALARELVQDQTDEHAQLRALWGWVLENIEEAGDLSTSATRTLAARTGNRLMLLRSMLSVVGVRSELWLLRDKFGARSVDGGHPMPELYDAPVLAVWPDTVAHPLIVSTVSRVMPLGYLAPAHVSASALRLHLAEGDRLAGVDQSPAAPPRLKNRRSYDLKLDVDERGDGFLSGTIALEGMEGIQWREILKEVDADRIDEVFQQSELARLLPGATFDLENVEIDHRHNTDMPLILRFRATAKGVGVHQGGELVVPATVVPMNMGLRYTRLPSRWSGLAIRYAPEQEARVEINLMGAKWTAMPLPEQVRGPYGGYERQVEGGGIGASKVVLHTRSTLELGVIEPERYADLVGYTRGLESAERAVLRAR
ncbi:MAG: hypothetical protein V3V08_25405 [Nannocystaceae bacterium]